MHAGLAVPFAAPAALCRLAALCACRCCSSAALSVQLGQIAGLQLCVHAGDAPAVQRGAVLHAGLAVALCSPCSFVQGCTSVCMQVMLQQCNVDLCCMQGSLYPMQPLQLCAGLLLCVHAGGAAAVQRGAVMHAGLAVPFAAPCSPCRFVQGCCSVCMQVVLQQCSTQCSAWADCRVAALCACRWCCSSATWSCAACRACCALCSPCSFVAS